MTTRHSFQQSANRRATGSAIIARRFFKLRRVKSLKDWIRAFRLSNRTAGIIIGEHHPNGRHGIPYSKYHISHARNGHRDLTPEALRAVQLATDAMLKEQAADVVRAKIKFSGEWRVTVSQRCVTCRHFFKPERNNIKRCKGCRP